MITNRAAGTRVDEVAEGIYRISTPVTVVPGGFSFNQYLIVDEEPLLFHTGPRRLFPLVREAIAAVLPPERLRYVGLLALRGGRVRRAERVPRASRHGRQPLCGRVAAMVSVDDLADRKPRGARRRRVARARPPRGALARRAPRPPRLGVRLPLRGDARARCCAATSSRSPAPSTRPSPSDDILGAERGDARRARLLRPLRRHAAPRWSAWPHLEPRDARLHARLRLGRGRRRAPARARRRAVAGGLALGGPGDHQGPASDRARATRRV